jgi:hypothetical protein
MQLPERAARAARGIVAAVDAALDRADGNAGVTGE